MEPVVSVLIPAYRAEGFIARSAGSALNQTLREIEVIISCDDGKDYLEILKAQGISDARLRTVSTGAVGTGPAHARNTALDAARANIIAMMDADDAFLPPHLEQMVPPAQKHGAALSQIEFIRHDTGAAMPNRGKPAQDGLKPLEELLLICAHTYAPIVFDRRQVKRRWNEQVRMIEDTVFLAECCDALSTVWYKSKPSYRYFHRSGSICNRPEAAHDFLKAGNDLLALLEEGKTPIQSSHVRRVLAAYVRKNNRIEAALEKAMASGEAKDYQEFIGKNLALLHSPLI